MATIELRVAADGKKSYRVKIRMRGSPTVSGTFERKSDAKKFADEASTSIRNEKYFGRVKGQDHTVEELIDKYCEEVLIKKKLKTQVGQTPQLKWWKKELGRYTLAAISPKLLTECTSRLKKSKDGIRSDTTVKRYMAVLSHVFTKAVKAWRWVDENPFRKVEYPSEPKGRVRFLTADEQKELLAACEKSQNPNLYPLVLLALATGGRKAELLGLRWQDVDTINGQITFRDTKNGESRSVPVRGVALDHLRRIPRTECELVFPNEKGTGPASIRHAWEAAVSEAALQDFRFHDLRHTCASYLAMSNATTIEIAAVLGHKTLAMVKRYSHLSEQHTANTLDRMTSKFIGIQIAESIENEDASHPKQGNLGAGVKVPETASVV